MARPPLQLGSKFISAVLRNECSQNLPAEEYQAIRSNDQRKRCSFKRAAGATRSAGVISTAAEFRGPQRSSYSDLRAVGRWRILWP